jgi:hypothetical protein
LVFIFIYFKFEKRDAVEDYKQQKTEYLNYIRMQNEVKCKVEKEYKSKVANMEIENFRRRVNKNYLKLIFFLLIFFKGFLCSTRKNSKRKRKRN